MSTFMLIESNIYTTINNGQQLSYGTDEYSKSFKMAVAGQQLMYMAVKTLTVGTRICLSAVAQAPLTMECDYSFTKTAEE